MTSDLRCLAGMACTLTRACLVLAAGVVWERLTEWVHGFLCPCEAS